MRSTRSVSETGAFEAIVETLGHDRLLYGTNFYISHMRGRCIAIGDSFRWLYAEEMALEEKDATLRSLFLAIHRLKLNEGQIEDIFYNNAARLFGF